MNNDDVGYHFRSDHHPPNMENNTMFESHVWGARSNTPSKKERFAAARERLALFWINHPIWEPANQKVWRKLTTLDYNWKELTHGEADR